MKRITAQELMGYGRRANQPTTPEQRELLRQCRASFRAFLRYWKFRNRETGEICSFATLWDGQEEFAGLMERERWIYALKAGKLGFTELECAYDGWVLRFGPRNARVHLFSQDMTAAQSLIRYVRFGLQHLPPWMRLPIADEPGAATTTSFKLRAGYDDVRTVVAYASSPNAAIDQSATHAHVDELSHMLFAEQTWYAVSTGVAPGGSCHVVTRGAGDEKFSAELWEQAQGPNSRLVPFFAPYSARPDRDISWRAEQSNQLNLQGLLHFAPETAEDALAGDETSVYIPLPVWDQCYDADVPPPRPGDKDPLVLGVDAAVRGDCFAVVAVSRHPSRHEDPAIRAVKVWRPEDFGGTIDFVEVERWLRVVCGGGCQNGHPESMPDLSCSLCQARSWQPPLNVVEVVFDPYQMESMIQRLKGIVWTNEFTQGPGRAVADAKLYHLALTRRLAHRGEPVLREHVGNARARLQKDEDSRMRIIKAAPSRKVDLVVASSMAVSECLRLNL